MKGKFREVGPVMLWDRSPKIQAQKTQAFYGLCASDALQVETQKIHGPFGTQNINFRSISIFLKDI